MFATRMSAPGLRSRYVERGTDAVLAVAPSVLVAPPPRSAYGILTLGATPKAAFFMGVFGASSGWTLVSLATTAKDPRAGGSPENIYEHSCAGLRSLVRACMGCAEEYTAAACDSRCPLYQPEGLVCALHSVPSETEKPKVIGLYPSQVSDALISQKGAKGLNAGRSLAGWCIA